MNEACDALLETLKKVAVLLKEAHVPFAVGGSYGVYARGGPSSEHDVDILLKRSDVDRAVKVLTEHGMRAVSPPEDWLEKVYDEDRLVDLIYRPSERPVDDDMLARTDEVSVGAVLMPVLPATDLLVNKLLAMGEHYCDFASVLPLARALREQIDWAAARAETAHSPYAEAFLLVCERLNLVEEPSSAPAPRLREVYS
jgi:predicted nucleotidyltransferase